MGERLFHQRQALWDGCHVIWSCWCLDGSVDVVIEERLGRQMNRFSFPDKDNKCLPLYSLQNYSDNNPASCSIASGAILPGLKQPGREITTHLHPFMRLRIGEIIQAGHAVELSTVTTVFLTGRLVQKNKKYRQNGKTRAWPREPSVRLLSVVSAWMEMRQ